MDIRSFRLIVGAALATLVAAGPAWGQSVKANQTPEASAITSIDFHLYPKFRLCERTGQ